MYFSYSILCALLLTATFSISTYYKSNTPDDDSTLATNGIPNAVPNGAPTYMPMDVLNAVPNGAPTYMLTHVLNAVPNGAPTYMPMDVLNAVPNGAPTYMLTHVSNAVPNGVPNGEPTYMPMHVPTGVPTDVPSYELTNNVHSEPPCFQGSQIIPCQTDDDMVVREEDYFKFLSILDDVYPFVEEYNLFYDFEKFRGNVKDTILHKNELGDFRKEDTSDLREEVHDLRRSVDEIRDVLNMDKDYEKVNYRLNKYKNGNLRGSY